MTRRAVHGHCFVRPRAKLHSFIKRARRTTNQLRPEFEQSGMAGEISAFIEDMPAAYARADLIVCRSGAGAVSELAAAGKPSILIPFPLLRTTINGTTRNSFRDAGAALLYTDREWTGAAMFEAVTGAGGGSGKAALDGNGGAIGLAHAGAASRAADILEEAARKIVDSDRQSTETIT